MKLREILGRGGLAALAGAVLCTQGLTLALAGAGGWLPAAAGLACVGAALAARRRAGTAPPPPVPRRTRALFPVPPIALLRPAAPVLTNPVLWDMISHIVKKV